MDLVTEALQVLGIERLVLGVHDACFPATPGEDLGRGSPYAPSGHDLLAFARELGFTAIQLGPQGVISEVNASPYDGTVFSRSTAAIALGTLARDDAFRGLLSDETRNALARDLERADHRVALRAAARALDECHARFVAMRRSGEGRELAARLDAFRERNAAWLEADALYEALQIEHQGQDWAHWSNPIDRALLVAGDPAARARRGLLLARYGAVLERWALGQLIAHAQHEAFREHARALGLAVFGDLQIGWSRRDLWAHRDAFLADYAMGAPPSRTNPDGQPWGYPVLDPATRVPGGVALKLLAERIGKALDEYDGLRIDHPHGLVCPWVYRVDAPDPLAAVQGGARLFSSPDLPDHPALARYAIARPDQLDRTQRRYADGWVRALDDAEVDRYAVAIDLVIEAAREKGRAPRDVACEVLSTMPYPLGRVLARHGLGRFRVTQKVGLDDPDDVYRSENAAPEDWVMVGNHDTPPVWRCARAWVDAGRGEAHAAYLAERLAVADRAAFVAEISRDPAALARAKLAELFVGPARNVFVWWADLFGETAIYNRPGVVDDANWSLRIPVAFREVWARRRDEGTAMDLRAALAAALRARALRPDLAAALTR